MSHLVSIYSLLFKVVYLNCGCNSPLIIFCGELNYVCYSFLLRCNSFFFAFMLIIIPITVHNHPSGDATPSREDIEVSERLVEAGHIVGIACLDHVIIGEDHYVSMKQRGYMNG